VSIKYPKDNILDLILKCFGKKRKIIIPKRSEELYEKYGQYAAIKAKKEGFWKA